MKTRSKKFFLVLGLLVLLAAAFTLKTFHDAGEFKQIVPRPLGACRPVEGVLSSEDITIHAGSGLAFISSDDRRPLLSGRRGRQGAILLYDLKAENGRLVNLTEGWEMDFHPHGIGLYEAAPGGNLSLFVVNHRRDGHHIEIFDFRDNHLVHRESISDPLMHSPNDVLPVGPRSFYVSNDHGSASGWARTLEDYLQLSRSGVLYFDGRTFSRAAGGMAYANGVNLSPDGRYVYVAATVGQEVRIYERNKDTGGLTLQATVKTGTGVDNIEMDGAGRLWVGAHPKLLTFVRYSKNPAALSPSQVLRLTPAGPGGGFRIEEVYLEAGQALSGSSVAAPFERQLLIGSVFDGRFLLCQLPAD